MVIIESEILRRFTSQSDSKSNDVLDRGLDYSAGGVLSLPLSTDHIGVSIWQEQISFLQVLVSLAQRSSRLLRMVYGEMSVRVS